MFQKGVAKIHFLKYWPRKNFSGNKVLGYCLEMPNQYFPFQSVPERAVAQIYFLNYWSKKKLSGNKVVGYC